MPKEKPSQNSSGDKSRKRWKRIGLATLGLAGLGAAGYYYLRYRHKQAFAGDTQYDHMDSPSMPEYPNSNPRSNPNNSRTDAFPLGMNSRGKRVELVQHALNTMIGTRLQTDGIWGRKTQAAMELAQSLYPQLINSLLVTQTMYQRLEEAISSGKAGLGGSIEPQVRVIADVDTHVYDGGKGLEAIPAGTTIGNHHQSENGTTAIVRGDGQFWYGRTTDLAFL